MLIIKSVSEYKKWRQSIRDDFETVGLVPTMGALHDGHASLLAEAKKKCRRVVLSIFVNPSQFGPGEDFEEYPRTFSEDCALAEAQGVDVVFAPSADEMYPEGYSTYVNEEFLSLPLCGESRPGHFRGVTTIVLKLFHIIEPQSAFFGLKDAQQFFVLKKMAEDLNLDVELVGCPTVREGDGLAMSSRNRYLSDADREIAPELRRTILSAKERLLSSAPIMDVLDLTRVDLEARGFIVQYFECLRLPLLVAPVEASLIEGVEYLIAAAVKLGETRLIDNELI